MRLSFVQWVLPLLVVASVPACATPQLRPLASVEADAPDTDLRFLVPLVRSKTVVGLGEATHGSHEIFAAKARVVDLLVRDGVVGTVAFEMGYADGLLIDRYVTGRWQSDPRELLKATKTFSIANTDVLALIVRLRALNERRSQAERVHFFGYDVQTPGREAALIADWLEKTGFAEKIPLGESLTNLVQRKDVPIQAYRPDSAVGVKSDLTQFQALLADYRVGLEAASSAEEFAEIKVAAHVIGQAFDLLSATSLESAYDQRDAAGAANILFRQAEDGRPVLVWAHNGHINKGSYEFLGARLLGGRLADSIGESYYAIATAFYEGDVRAFHAKDGLIVNRLPPAREASIDAMLNSVGPDKYFADFTEMRTDPEWSNLLTSMSVMRGVGGGYEPEVDTRTYRPTKLGEQFDAVLFVRRLTSSTPL